MEPNVASASSDAERLLKGDRRRADSLARQLLIPQRDNLVERPWGGDRLRAFKGLSPESGSPPVGEAFELAADDTDQEAREHPSIVRLGDGSTISLAALLEANADELLGEPFVARYGRRLPLLPKLLDVAELLSVQAHPPGNTEVYVIIAAEPGATLRLGFARDTDAPLLKAKLAAGRREQQRLLASCAPSMNAEVLQTLLKPWLARRTSTPAELEAKLRPSLAASGAWENVAECLAALHSVYWRVLDGLNAIPVHAGDVIYNANPERIAAQRGGASAEVHALGNPEGRAILALEIRRPGPTFRAWDNVRFPLRAIDIDAALAALNLAATQPADFVVQPCEVRPGVRRSVDCEYFRLEHLAPTAAMPIEVARTAPHTLHVLAGACVVRNAQGEAIGELVRGASALVPAGVGAYRIFAAEEPVLMVKVELPPYER